MSEPTRAVLVLSGRVEAPELQAVLSRALRADPNGPVHVNCTGGRVAHRRRPADAGQIMATVTDRLAETVTRRRAATPAECRPPSPRPRWDAAYSLN
ncbi:hypothetical protein GobsT_58120 [Gemmata obscuriglobus]|nr:hypothetical protein GobsT_58120 [Gemmata obscuriglobus]VTS10327.1 unnamed protein product [Gemmata obscuriglobus UQM 2246]